MEAVRRQQAQQGRGKKADRWGNERINASARQPAKLYFLRHRKWQSEKVPPQPRQTLAGSKRQIHLAIPSRPADRGAAVTAQLLRGRQSISLSYRQRAKSPNSLSPQQSLHTRSGAAVRAALISFLSRPCFFGFFSSDRRRVLSPRGLFLSSVARGARNACETWDLIE